MPRKAAVEQTEKIVKKIPATENGPGVLCTTKSGKVFHVTQNLEKGKFTLWSAVTGGFKKIATANSPLDLYDKISWDK